MSKECDHGLIDHKPQTWLNVPKKTLSSLRNKIRHCNQNYEGEYLVAIISEEGNEFGTRVQSKKTCHLKFHSNYCVFFSRISSTLPVALLLRAAELVDSTAGVPTALSEEAE